MSLNAESSSINNSQLPDLLTEEDVDALITEQLNQMSTVDREKALYDIHGVIPDSSIIKETPELVARSLEELQSKMDQIKEKDAYNLAASQDPSFVSDRLFRLKCLRAKNFEMPRAVERFNQFFEIKLELFGKDRLTKTITLDDLDPDDIACLNSGFCSILPIQDRAGRTVVCWMQQLIGTFSLQSTVS